MSIPHKKRVFSGVQPSGNMHIGNYLGAIKQFVALQDEYNCIFCIVDEHAITIPQEPRALREKTLEIALIYLAAGIDPAKSMIFVQSHVPAHTELGWILNTMTPLGELERMVSLRITALNWFRPLYGDYSRLGIAIGIPIRLMRILATLVLYAFVLTFFAAGYAVYLVLPMFLVSRLA